MRKWSVRDVQLAKIRCCRPGHVFNTHAIPSSLTSTQPHSTRVVSLGKTGKIRKPTPVKRGLSMRMSRFNDGVAPDRHARASSFSSQPAKWISWRLLRPLKSTVAKPGRLVPKISQKYKREKKMIIIVLVQVSGRFFKDCLTYSH